MWWCLPPHHSYGQGGCELRAMGWELWVRSYGVGGMRGSYELGDVSWSYGWVKMGWVKMGWQLWTGRHGLAGMIGSDGQGVMGSAWRHWVGELWVVVPMGSEQWARSYEHGAMSRETCGAHSCHSAHCCGCICHAWWTWVGETMRACL